MLEHDRPSADQRGDFGLGHRVEVALERGEKIFAVGAPSGACLYTYADRGTAETEATALNGGAFPPAARTVSVSSSYGGTQ